MPVAYPRRRCDERVRAMEPSASPASGGAAPAAKRPCVAPSGQVRRTAPSAASAECARRLVADCEVHRALARVEAHNASTAEALQQVVAQVVHLSDTVGALSQQLAELHTLPGLTPRVPLPLAPAFAQLPPSPPRTNPPTRSMQPWEKSALQRWIRSGRLSASRCNGILKICEPGAVRRGDLDIDVDKYDDYTLWKLWAFIKDDAPLEAVLTADEAAELVRLTAAPKAAPRARLTAPPATEADRQLVLAQQGDRQVRRAGAPAP